MTPWTATCQGSLSFWSLLKFMSIESVIPSNHLILCQPLLLLPSIFPNIRIFSNESALCIRWPRYWSLSSSNGFADHFVSFLYIADHLQMIAFLYLSFSFSSLFFILVGLGKTFSIITNNSSDNGQPYLFLVLKGTYLQFLN